MQVLPLPRLFEPLLSLVPPFLHQAYLFATFYYCLCSLILSMFCDFFFLFVFFYPRSQLIRACQHLYCSFIYISFCPAAWVSLSHPSVYLLEGRFIQLFMFACHLFIPAAWQPIVSVIHCPFLFSRPMYRCLFFSRPRLSSGGVFCIASHVVGRFDRVVCPYPGSLYSFGRLIHVIPALNYHLERGVPLQNFTPPDQVRYEIEAGVFTKSGQSSFSARSRNKGLLSSNLDFNNYDKKFSLMLYLEEIQMELDIRRYDQTDQKMKPDDKNRNLLVLDVPGVAESRPSVLRGDHLFVTLSEERSKSDVISYKGYVHAVELEKVKLGFSHRLLQRFLDGMKFDVVFTFNRLPLKVQHRAVQMVKEKAIDQFVFPTRSSNITIENTERLVLYDRSLESNEEQMRAVKHIVSGISRPAPYLIFGPPGTGKTVTLVEAIKQVLKCTPGTHVLTCAPSNSACDLLCQRLLKHLGPNQIYRMMASSRNYRDVPEDIKPCCNWDSREGCFVYPRKMEIMKYKVVITTLVTAARLVSANFPEGHFTHVFIDESGHAVEPECVTAIAGILDQMDPTKNANGGQLVLAGDPKQLGPILRSPFALDNGLGMSLLERLMTQNSLYQKGSEGYNSQFVTKLLKNYRSHPKILEVPNELFYDNELQSCADELQSHSYCNWEKLPRRGCPIIFHGVLGKDDREGNSPSFFNVNEVQEIIFYLLALLDSQGKKGLARLSPKEIGIISPYRKQVEKIRTAINSHCKGVSDIKDLKVGSVEEFQGQERKVILISTVRSSETYVKHDEDFNLGFLKNPKRFNVAITRAKALLILVGNPIILSKDTNWCKFLNYCRDNGAYTGFPIEELDVIHDEELTAMLSSLNIDGPPAGVESGESVVQQQAEPEWRSEV
uniref:RNA helicase n=1 Tax=Leptobrachium leishanense TaxID=445787 RepID=A0A8C5MH71_9ANUR